MSQTPVPEPMDRREAVRVVEQRGPTGEGTPAEAVAERGERVVYDPAAVRRQILHRVTQLFWLLVTVIEMLIGARFVLKLIGANPNHPFAQFVHGASELFVAPFAGLVPVLAFGGSALEIHSLIAMLVYALVTWVIVRFVWLAFDRPAARAVTTYERGVGSGEPPDRRAA